MAAPLAVNSAGSTRLATIAPRWKSRWLERACEVGRLVGGRGFERRHDDERGAVVAEQPLDRCGVGDEPLLHRLEQDEELGDVLQEPRAEHAIGD